MSATLDAQAVKRILSEYSNFSAMKYSKQYAGKWVVSKNEKIIASDKSFAKLQLKIKNRKDSKTLMYSLVPKGYIVG